VPDGDAADDAAYAYGGGEAGESYTVDFSTPYTSFLFTILSGAASIFVAFVHWRTPTWNSEIVEKYY